MTSEKRVSLESLESITCRPVVVRVYGGIYNGINWWYIYNVPKIVLFPV